MLEKAVRDDDLDIIKEALNAFRCDKDSDIESFLREKALDYENKNLCRVYLLLNEDDFDSNKLKVEAYFTVSSRAITLKDVSNTKTKKLTGFVDRKVQSFVLIGQIGKYIDANYTSDITIKNILDNVIEVVYEINQMVPCKFMLVECSKELHERGFYSRQGFKFLQEDGGFFQYYKPL